MFAPWAVAMRGGLLDLDEAIAERDLLKAAAAERDELKARCVSLRTERNTLDRMVQKLSVIPAEQRRLEPKSTGPITSEKDAAPSA